MALFVIALPFVSRAGTMQGQSQASTAELARVRNELNAAYSAWSKARNALDLTTFNKMLAPDFYVLDGGQKESRAAFIKEISANQPGVTLTRFDSDILTLARDKHLWVAVILEKLEGELTGKDGKKRKVFSCWVTKDGWEKVGGQWEAHYTEAIGQENWIDKAPPVAGWSITG